MNRPPPPPALKPGGIRRNVHHIELMPPRNVQQPILSFNNQSLTFLLNVLTLLMGSINVGIIGYNFSYYKVFISIHTPKSSNSNCLGY